MKNIAYMESKNIVLISNWVVAQILSTTERHVLLISVARWRGEGFGVGYYCGLDKTDNGVSNEILTNVDRTKCYDELHRLEGLR